MNLRHATAAFLLATAMAPAAAQSPATVPPAGLEAMRQFARDLMSEGLYDETIEAFRSIVAETPRDPRSHYDLAGALTFVRRFAEAAPVIETAITLSPEEPLYHELAALTYEQLRDFERAKAATERAAALGDVKAMFSLAGMYEHGRGTEPSAGQALRWLERAARGGHLGAMDAMVRVYTDGLYGQRPDAERARSWQERLERELQH